jgi:aldehyde dehydrogenase (NAD+)
MDTVWGKLNAAERGRLLMRLSASITAHADELAALEQRDCGKPVRQARADATALARYFEFYAGACDKLHGETIPYLDGYSVLTWREPHGVTGHIIPWNYPMQIFGRSVGGALAAGNVCVVKPAEDACLSLIRVAQLAAEVGFPAGALNIVTGYGHEVGDALARHPGIDHISFTGSPKIGTLIQQAGRRAPLPGHAGARRQEPADRLCRCRPGRRDSGHRQCHRAERRADLLRRLASAGRAGDLRAAAAAPRRGLLGAARRARRDGPGPRAR